MALEDKPYRVYRGGRVKGKVPTLPRPERKPADRQQRGAPGVPQRYSGPGPVRKPKRKIHWGRWIGLAALVLVAVFVVWAVAAYLSVQSGVETANKRLGKSARNALVPQDGSLLSNSTHILLLGTDSDGTSARRGFRRTDSIMLMRTDPGRNRIAYLSIPRDLVVEIPGYGNSKINAAMQVGGPRLAVLTVKKLTGLPVNHVAVVDFSQFEDLIDKLGGIDITVAKPIVSKFDCPYATEERCARWPGWRFAKGKQHMDGHRALIYSRVRKNALDPSDTDFARAERNQQVLNAVAGKLTSFGTLVELPFIGDDLLAPITTDLSTHSFLSLGWSKFRSSSGSTLHCRLGGEASGGEIRSVEENLSVIQEFNGAAAPQPPVPGSGAFGPGCVTGSQTLGVR